MEFTDNVDNRWINYSSENFKDMTINTEQQIHDIIKIFNRLLSSLGQNYCTIAIIIYLLQQILGVIIILE